MRKILRKKSQDKSPSFKNPFFNTPVKESFEGSPVKTAASSGVKDFTIGQDDAIQKTDLRIGKMASQSPSRSDIDLIGTKSSEAKSDPLS